MAAPLALGSGVEMGNPTVEVLTSFPSPAGWRESWIYFMMVDRFNNLLDEDFSRRKSLVHLPTLFFTLCHYAMSRTIAFQHRLAVQTAFTEGDPAAFMERLSGQYRQPLLIVTSWQQAEHRVISFLHQSNVPVLFTAV